MLKKPVTAIANFARDFIIAHPILLMLFLVGFGGYKSYDDNLTRIGGAEPRFSDRAGAVLSSALWWTDVSLPSLPDLAAPDGVDLIEEPEFLDRVNWGKTFFFYWIVSAVLALVMVKRAHRKEIEEVNSMSKTDKWDLHLLVAGKVFLAPVYLPASLAWTYLSHRPVKVGPHIAENTTNGSKAA